MTIDNIIDNLEYKEQVVDHIKYEAQSDVKMQKAMYYEWLCDYATAEQQEYTTVSDYEEIIECLVEQSSPREVGEQYNIDWTGLAESFGLC